jgi:CDP-diacylglycerol--glycerol-3-phosphate 3-phosphatidyltransferase
MLWRKWLPNALTGLRIALGILVFFGLAGAAGTLGAAVRAHQPLVLASFAGFVIGAVTDWFDGYLARLWKVQSVWGAILDPIADKIAVGAAILGLALLEPGLHIAVPGFLILLRELFVSGLREVTASRGLTFPVTRLAKWKTTLQLSALALEMLAAGVAPGPLTPIAHALLWLAALITLWTGAQYAEAARRALRTG